MTKLLIKETKAKLLELNQDLESQLEELSKTQNSLVSHFLTALAEFLVSLGHDLKWLMTDAHLEKKLKEVTHQVVKPLVFTFVVGLVTYDLIQSTKNKLTTFNADAKNFRPV